MATEKRTFYGPDIDLPALARGLSDHFSFDGYQTQIMPVANGGFMVQAHKEDTFRKIAGMSSALTVVLQMEGEYLAVESGGAKWAELGSDEQKVFVHQIFPDHVGISIQLRRGK